MRVARTPSGSFYSKSVASLPLYSANRVRWPFSKIVVPFFVRFVTRFCESSLISVRSYGPPPPSTGGLPSDKIINTTKFDGDNHRKVWLLFVAHITLLPFLPYFFVVNRVTMKLQSSNFKAGIFKESKVGKCGNLSVRKITNWNGWKVRSLKTWKLGYLGIWVSGSTKHWKLRYIEIRSFVILKI